jgi:hypothetical protein
MKKKLPQIDLNNLPSSAAEYIKKVIRKMRYRRRVQADVMSELESDFESELKECTDDQQKEQKAQELIDQFGDVKMLAAMLRRAKKRYRPIWQTAIVRTFQAICLLMLCFIIYLGWFLSGKPAITIDYAASLNRLTQSKADESENAAPVYLKVSKFYQEIPKDISNLLDTKYINATSEQTVQIQHWLQDNKEILDSIVAASKMPYCWFTYTNERSLHGDSIQVHGPGLNTLSMISKALSWRAVLNARVGQIVEAINDILACYRFGQQLKGDKNVVHQILGILIESHSTKALRNIISENKVDTKILADFQNDLENIIRNEKFVVSFEISKMYQLDTIQKLFTDGGLGNGHLYLPRLVDDFRNQNKHNYNLIAGYIISGLFYHPNKEQTIETLNKFYDYWEQLSLKTPAQIHKESTNIDEELKSIVKGNLFLETATLIAGNHILESIYQNKVDAEATLTVLAITRYKLDKGQYPDNLEQLVDDGYLNQLPIDPFSDKPLAYKQKDGDFILYSYSLNCTDEGGQPDERTSASWSNDGDAVF